MNKSIYQAAKELNIPMDHHESDLYLKVCEESTKLVHSYKSQSNVKTFISQIDNERWYDIPFAFDPFWEHKPR